MHDFVRDFDNQISANAVCILPLQWEIEYICDVVTLGDNQVYSARLDVAEIYTCYRLALSCFCACIYNITSSLRLDAKGNTKWALLQGTAEQLMNGSSPFHTMKPITTQKFVPPLNKLQRKPIDFSIKMQWNAVHMTPRLGCLGRLIGSNSSFLYTRM